MKRRKKKGVCKMLEEAAKALYYVYDICPRYFNCASYEALSNDIDKYAVKLKCKVK